MWRGTAPIVILNDAWTARGICEIGAIPSAPNENSSLSQPSAAAKYRSFRANQAKALTMSLLSEPDDYATACKRYSDSIVSIIWGGRSAAAKNGHMSKKAARMVDIAECDFVAGYLRSAKWLAHTLRFFLRNFLHGSASSLNQKRPREDLPSICPNIMLGERKYFGLFDTGSIPET